MNANTLVNYRKMIESELAQLSAIDRGLRADLLNAAETTPTILHDYYDHARAERDLDTRLEIHEQQSLRRRQLECALERIRKGAFGVCVKCGDDIAERRLMAQPHAACSLHRYLDEIPGLKHLYIVWQDLNRLLRMKRLNQRNLREQLPEFLWIIDELRQIPFRHLRVLGETLENSQIGGLPV